MNALILDIARIAEAAFRRGYQHGHGAGCGDFGEVPSEKAVHDWRFFRDQNKAATSPHEKRSAWGRMSSVDRLLIECERDTYPALYELLHKYANAAPHGRAKASTVEASCPATTTARTDARDDGKWRRCELVSGHDGDHSTTYCGRPFRWPQEGRSA